MANRIETKAVHAGDRPDYASIESTHTPLYLTNTFLGRSLADFEGKYLYSRVSNPNQVALEEKYAALHGGVKALCFSSGMAAISSLFLAMGKDTKVVAGTPLYAGTYTLLKHELPNKLAGFSVDFGRPGSATIAPLASSGEKALYFETPANPALNVFDIPTISRFVRKYNPHIMVVVDNTFATPILQRPLELGADIIVESLTKFAGDEGTRTGGIVVLGERGMDYFDELFKTRALFGGCLDPEAAFHMAKSLKTLNIRVRTKSENARRLSESLSKIRYVSKVYYPGFGSMVSLEVRGDKHNVNNFAGAIAKTFVKLAVSLGSSDTMIAHPWTMLYGNLPDEEKKELGINYNLFRISVGLENPEDISNVFEHLTWINY